MKRPYLWFFAVGWVILAVGITYARFGYLPGDWYEIAAAIEGFFLLGMLTGWIFLFFWRKAENRLAKVLIVTGYILAIPFTYWFGIIGPLTLEIIPILELPRPITFLILFPIAIAFWGPLPSTVLMAIGLIIGNLINWFEERLRS